MKVRVQFWSGTSHDFIIPEDTLAVDFVAITAPVGGRIRKLEFL